MSASSDSNAHWTFRKIFPCVDGSLWRCSSSNLAMNTALGWMARVILSAAGVMTFCTGCFSPKSDHQNQASITSVYDTADRIKLMPRCEVQVDNRSPCSVGLITAEGKRLTLGGPGATPEIAKFLPTFQSGQTYTLPDAFLEYQKNYK